MRIPKSFKLYDHEIKVVLKDTVKDYDDPEKELFGFADWINNEIHLATKDNGKTMPKTQVGHSFYHELVHHILYKMGEHKLNKKEKFVDQLAGLLHQAFSTAKYK